MKQKRTYVTLLLILALLILGVAYALIQSDMLTITGTATASVAEGNVDVEFVDVTPEKTGDATTYGEITSDPDIATFTVAGLTTAEDTKTVTFTIENKTENGVPVTLETPTIQWKDGKSTHEYYEITYQYGKTDLAAYDASGDDDSTTLVVTVKLLKTISTTDTVTAANENNEVTITLNAKAANN